MLALLQTQSAPLIQGIPSPSRPNTPADPTAAVRTVYRPRNTHFASQKNVETLKDLKNYLVALTCMQASFVLFYAMGISHQTVRLFKSMIA